MVRQSKATMERLGVSIEKSNRMRVGAERETFTTMVAYKGGKEERQAVKNKEVASKKCIGETNQHLSERADHIFPLFITNFQWLMCLLLFELTRHPSRVLVLASYLLPPWQNRKSLLETRIVYYTNATGLFAY